MKVCITGICGFIGSHLADELINHGYEVCGIDCLDPQVHGSSPKVPDYMDPRVEVVIGDVASPRDVIRTLEGLDTVVHLAARVGVGQSTYEAPSYVYNNVFGTSVLLDTLQRYGYVKRLIVASSMSVYGEGAGEFDDSPNAEYIPEATDEDHPPALQSIYALTKYDQERLCLLWGRAYGVSTIALRFFNVYGTRQSLSNPYTGAMAIFASRLLNNKPPIIFEDGLQRRDFVHVSDVVRGIRLALESDLSDEVINIGSGQSCTILQVAETLAIALDREHIKPTITGQHRTGDIRHCFADITKARQLLGYEPQMSFCDGISDYVQWLKTQVAVDKLNEHVEQLEAKGLLK